ncbi:MAG TPA: c-type cytochrome [Bryobacteraceae bacterium]|nr:c-type cytochrome [Bryobacteraceae bacterium]
MEIRSLLCAALLTAGRITAQEGHGVSPADLERGLQIYLNNCAGCHGPDGDLISGVNLRSGHFRRAQTDNDLRRVVTKGISGTPMPPGNYSDQEAGRIVAYLRSMAASGAVKRAGPPGNPAAGKTIVEGKGGCLQCHRIGRLGTVAGPDLTGIGGMRRAADLETSLIDPDAEIRPDNLTVRAVAKDGAKITGRLMNMDTYSLQILESGSERLRTLRKDQLREFEVMKKSPMPTYRDKLSAQEISDVVAYLISLKEKM